ncbi:MAG TPA: hypothetical protein VGQ24_00295 [Gemmatimonadales bacterium]|nr:hypothetical protein [Gemmatimonadales bacterium]
MRLNQGMIPLVLSAAALTSPMMGCAGYRVVSEPYAHDYFVYDPYVHDYYRWDLDEDRIYQRWEIETRRGHMDFPRRSPGEQRAYWSWRHR